MKFNKLMVMLVTLCALAIVPAMYGQAQAQPDQPKQDQADRPSGEQSVTGCLTESGGSYTLATSSGDQVSLTGSADLAKHKDHTITVTGKKSDAGGKTSMTVSKIQMVAASCSK